MRINSRCTKTAAHRPMERLRIYCVYPSSEAVRYRKTICGIACNMSTPFRLTRFLIVRNFEARTNLGQPKSAVSLNTLISCAFAHLTQYRGPSLLWMKTLVALHRVVKFGDGVNSSIRIERRILRSKLY